MPWEDTEFEVSLGYAFLTSRDLAWAVDLVRAPLREDLLDITDYDRFPRDFIEVVDMETGPEATISLRPIPHVLADYGVDPREFEEALNLGLRTAAKDLRHWKKTHNRPNVHSVSLRCGGLDFEQSFEKEEQLRLDQFF
ncbi:MAG: hypothetical protein MAG715_00523 [Methanonatronarchaeales archaeon]|nr:hypothetical protein [Methanonatronarchaeales archaeon]